MWGVAYKVSAQDVERVSIQLDHREKDGYARTTAIFYPSNNNEIPLKETTEMNEPDRY